ncbi:undecaprenyl-diphosphatase [Staphylococcus ureilyticus]|uniref:Undecaprenyl-diphosphatase n=1 Tax=Staphylococcus ureilyticus TaxID=94138 RepID=A0AB34AL46_STAUR|nr:undecaprenyl-diphosphatase [Staphylococcus ureilyticus]PNZ46391.1 undecaprenyl-diphosphatase [Staphylococcus ureilyticus]QKU19802.1 undecaprenyl-diphosphatase [Staphylococcus cohnii]GEQ04081.1 undecaprenyl-diphosphatase [Staphylococcus ureilyticus]
MNLSEVNIELFRVFNELSKHWVFLNPIMIFLSKYMKYFLILGVIIYWFTRKKQNRIMVICSIIAFIAGEVLGKIVGKLYSNHQPFAELTNVNQLIGHAIDNSFPSDHAIQFFSICVTFFLFKKKFKFIWLLLAFLVGISRIWVGVHYPGDIFVGAILGTLSAIICYLVIPSNRLILKLLEVYEKGEQLILSKILSKS